MKLWWAALAFASLVFAGPHVASAQTAPVRVIVNDVAVPLPAPAEVRGGVVLAPLAPIVQAFGASAQWDAPAQALVVRGLSGTTLRLVVGQTTVTAGDSRWDLPVAPSLQGGMVVGPVAAVLRGLGAYVKQHDEDGTLDAVSQVTGLVWRGDADGLTVTVSATGPVRAAGGVLHGPERLVVDLQSAVIRLKTPDAAIGSGPVIGVRTAQFHVRPYVTRLVFDLARPLPFQIATSPGTVTLALGAVGSPVANASAPTPAAPAPPAAASMGAPPSGAAAGTGQVGHGAQGPVPPASGGAAAPGGAAVGSAGSGNVGVSGSGQVSTNDSAGTPEPVALPALPEFADGPGAFHVQSVTYDDAAGQLVIRASQRATVTVHQWTYPDRLAIDIADGVFRDRRTDVEIGSGGIRNVVVSQFGLHPNVTRVLVHLNRKIAYTVTAADGGRTVLIGFADAGRVGPQPPAVIIDPGHGGDDSGAIGPKGTHEADIALNIGRMVKDALERQGTHTVLTRTDNTTVALEDRPDLAQRYGGIVFVSIHANASADPAVQGTTTYYYTPQSRALAEFVQAEVTRALGEQDRGLQTARFYVIVNTQMPAILVETAFISNPKEEAMLRDPAVELRIAEAIARGIEKFLAEQSQVTSH
ncbi:MAG TPA: N-acetylmuramoyl-L-alanine amidase family protein [bacterium]|nr:N-acetylmuramoyl-L-alanine amidase family protein [bacterium]